MLAGEPSARVVVAAFLLTALGALEVALVPVAGCRELGVEAGQLRPAADGALALAGDGDVALGFLCEELALE